MVMLLPFYLHVPQHSPWCIQPVIPCRAAPFVVKRAACPAQSYSNSFLLYYRHPCHDSAPSLASS